MTFCHRTPKKPFAERVLARVCDVLSVLVVVVYLFIFQLIRVNQVAGGPEAKNQEQQLEWGTAAKNGI